MSLHPRPVLAAESGTLEVEVTPAPDFEIDSPEGLGEATSVLVDAIEGLLEGFLRSLPLIGIGLLILLVGVLVARVVGRGTARDLRVTRLIDYDGEQVIIPNGEVFKAAVATVAEVLDTPAPQARCIEMGESSVNFEIRYWTAPDIVTVVDAQDRILRAGKSAIEGAGMQIPWPIRTVSFDKALTHTSGNGDGP